MILAVKVKPNARADALLGWDGDTLLVAVAAPPVDGKANAALVRFLGRLLGLAPSRLEVVRGTSSRIKHVAVPEGVDLGALR